MRTPSPRLGAALPLLVGAIVLYWPADRARAQPALDAPLIFQSIEGSIERVDLKRNGIVLKDLNGKAHAWKLGAPVIREAAQYKPGDWMWVIYRQIGGGDRAVTAIGFPGSQDKPNYVNATGETVVLRTGPYIEGACRAIAPEKTTEHELRAGSDFVDEAPCWCCANRGKSCELANRSHDEHGTGRIVLARCYP